MKFNWGYGIALFYCVFAGSLFLQVWKSTQYDHSLVSEQYYRDDINYQQHYDKLLNTQRLSQPLLVQTNTKTGQLSLRFPTELNDVEGTIRFFRPTTKKLDTQLPIQVNERLQQDIDISTLTQGYWILKVDWTSGGVDYYQEEEITL